MGDAWNVFLNLEQVWKHAHIPQKRNLEIYQGLVVPRLMYGLDSLWLRKADRARLDSFHVKCLRSVHGIGHSYWSRVSNADVLAVAQTRPLSSVLLQRQLILYGKLARMPEGAVQRQTLFDSSSNMAPKNYVGKRRRGRPRQMWGACVYQHAVKAAGSETDLANAVGNISYWFQLVLEHCKATEVSPPEPNDGHISA